MQATENTYELINWIEEKKIITKKDITENIQFSSKQELNETSLRTNSSELQEELSQIIQYFDKINIEEIDPIIVINEREKLLFKEGFGIIVDEINYLIFRLLNKGIVWQLLDEHVINYFNNHNINLQEIYNWSLYNQNSANSIFLLGYFNYMGIETSVDAEKAFNLFVNASVKNHILAQYFAGICYEFGNGTTKDEKLAFESLEKSAKKHFSHGELKIGYFYEYGLGITQNLKKAFYWYEKAANHGNISAMHNLGKCYLNGNGVENDYNKAFELFKKSAEGGNSRGMTMLGVCYETGIGTEIDKQKAFELYQKSANFGEIIAQYNLGNMYEYGKGITKDINKAIYWYGKSSEQGDQAAKNKLQKLQ